MEKFNDKYYKLNDDEPLRLLDARRDKHLIGKKIKVRSAATCALGDCVCAKCVGRSASLNYDIASGFAGYESEEVTKVVNQSILSAKHLLQTFSEVIEFNEAFYKYFKFSFGEIIPFIKDNPNFESMDHLAIYINDNDISRFDEMDSDSEYNTYISSGMFYVVDTNTGEMEEIKNINEKEIYISDKAFKMRKKNGGYIYFKDLEDDEKIFETVILNNELTKPLYNLMNLLNKANKEDIDETIDGMCQKFAELLVESNIEASIVSGEMIINRLIRDAVNTYERPDFTLPEIPPYKIYTVLKALEHNRSPIIGLSSPYLKRQLLSDEIVESRNGTSYLDPFYQKHVEF